ncbi:hypothetical protein BGZ81_001089 [Podila clonocystis]|nr:hypothetical protein BGZ81_001089 [Podila clonocystis]
MARVLPTHQVNLGGWRFSLNPGPFSIKGHVLIGTMVACNSGTAYAVDIVILQKLWYHNVMSFVAGMFLVLTTQITGFAMTGIIRRFLVRPAHMIWPATLVVASLFRSLHAQRREDNHGHMSHMRYFMIVAGGMFIYYWIPGFIFPTIGTITWICWINPNNIVLAQITGSNGLGIDVIALDWTAASMYISPLVTSWFAQLNILVGFILVVWSPGPTTPISGTPRTIQPLPLSCTRPTVLNDKSQVLDADGLLDENLYRAYGPLRMNSFFALTYGVGFAGLTSTLVHVILSHGKEIVERWKSARAEHEDIHSRLMNMYPEVPDWRYSPCIAFIFVLPVGIVQAVTNQQPGLNIVTEYVIGYLLPGHAIANITFKTYGYIGN